MVLIKSNTIYLHLIHAIVYAPFMVGYGLYNNNFLISRSVMDGDIFLLFYNVFKKNSIYLHRFLGFLVYKFLLIIL